MNGGDSISSKNAVAFPHCTNLPGYSGSSFWGLFLHLHQPRVPDSVPVSQDHVSVLMSPDESKTQLCNAISQWMIGTLPTPGSYTSWDYSQLELEKFKMKICCHQRNSWKNTGIPSK